MPAAEVKQPVKTTMHFIALLNFSCAFDVCVIIISPPFRLVARLRLNSMIDTNIVCM